MKLFRMVYDIDKPYTVDVYVFFSFSISLPRYPLVISEILFIFYNFSLFVLFLIVVLINW